MLACDEQRTVSWLLRHLDGDARAVASTPNDDTYCPGNKKCAKNKQGAGTEESAIPEALPLNRRNRSVVAVILKFPTPILWSFKWTEVASGMEYNLVGHFVGFHLQYQRINVSHITLTITLHSTCTFPAIINQSPTTPTIMTDEWMSHHDPCFRTVTKFFILAICIYW